MRKNKGLGYYTKPKSATQTLSNLCLTENTVAIDSESWLKSTVEQSQDSLLRHCRNVRSEIFLHSVLYHVLDFRSDIDEEFLGDLLVGFKKSFSGQGSDFEISHVLGCILNHFHCYAANDLDAPLGKPPLLEKDLLAFTILSELDLKAVDHMVIERMNDA